MRDQLSGTDESSAGYPGWRVAGAASVGVFVSFASLLVYTFGIFLKPLAEQFSWSRQSVSMAFAFAAMTVAVCSPPLGYLLDRYGPRRIILPCLITFGLAFASLAFLTPRLAHLYAIFVVLGVVGNGTAQMAYARAVSSWFAERRGLALALVMMGGGVGAMLLPPLAQSLIGHFGWRSAFAILGCGVLVIGVPVVSLLIRERPGSRRGTAQQSEGVTVREALRSRPFWIIVAVLFLCSLGQNGAITHLSALLTDRGIAASGAAVALSVMGAASLLGRFVGGWLLDRFFAPRVAVGLLSTAAAGILLLAYTQNLATGLFAAALIGAGMGGEADVTPYLLSRYYGLRSFSLLYGFTWTAYAVAGAIGPVLMGRAFDLTASYRGFTFQLALLSLVAAGLMLLLPAYGSAPALAPVSEPELDSAPAQV